MSKFQVIVRIEAFLALEERTGGFYSSRSSVSTRSSLGQHTDDKT